MTSVANVSPWLAEADELNPPLADDLEVDVAIIGAGLTGLCSALELQAQGLSVALIESATAGFGASGRNAGHLTPTIGKDLPTLTRFFGRERVRALLHLVETAIGYVETLIEQYAISCDYEPVGNIVAAVHPRQYANLDRAAAAAAAYGVAGELLEPDEMRKRGLPASFQRGYLEPHGGILHPGRYVRGLRRAALQAEIALYEQTAVQRIDATQPAVVHTPKACVRARHVVIATNAYTPTLGVLRSAVLPMYVQLFQTEPLSPAQHSLIDWRGHEGIYTAHEMLESYRLTSEGRIVGGAKHVRYGFAGRTLPDYSPALAASLELIFRLRFPQLSDLKITDHWGGPIAMALDFLPAVGRLGKHGNVLYAVGYAGHGVALASYAGRMLTDLLLERNGPGSALWSRRRLPLPPEPLRWLIVHQ